METQNYNPFIDIEQKRKNLVQKSKGEVRLDESSVSHDVVENWKSLRSELLNLIEEHVTDNFSLVHNENYLKNTKLNTEVLGKKEIRTCSDLVRINNKIIDYYEHFRKYPLETFIN